MTVSSGPDDGTFVLVHGAWDGAWIWEPVRQRLEHAGATVFCPTLPASGERAHLGGPHITLSTYVDDVDGLLVRNGLSDVIMVGSSFGGMTVTATAGRDGTTIAAVVYVDAFVPRNGQSFSDLVPAATVQGFTRLARAAKSQSGAMTEVMVPIFRVADGEDAAAWYKRLGFTVEGIYRFAPDPTLSSTSTSTMSTRSRRSSTRRFNRSHGCGRSSS